MMWSDWTEETGKTSVFATYKNNGLRVDKIRIEQENMSLIDRGYDSCKNVIELNLNQIDALYEMIVAAHNFAKKRRVLHVK